MSSIRSAGRFEFQNVGALTTTFTAPSSCPSIDIPWRGLEVPGLPGQMMLGLGSCSSADSDARCTPNGDGVGSMYKSVSDNGHAFDGKAYVEFRSPGLACPSAWETVGVVSAKDGSVDASGAFESTVFRYDADETTTLALPLSEFALNALTAVLAPTETAIACCPSGFTANPLYGCYSTIAISELAGGTGCAEQAEVVGELTMEAETFEYYGATITYENYLLDTAASGTPDGWCETTRTHTYTLDESGRPENSRAAVGDATREASHGLEFAPFMYLVNSGEESEGGGSSEDISDGKSRDESDGDGDGSDGGSGAQSVPAGSVTVISVVATAWAVGFLAVCSL